MDNGQGLVDCFLFSIPLALCPKSEEIKRAIAYLETESISDLEDIYRDIIQFHFNDNSILLMTKLRRRMNGMRLQLN